MAFSDDFNRADSGSVGNGWSDPAGSWGIASNAAQIQTDNGGFADQPLIAPASGDFADGTVSVIFNASTFSSVPQVYCRSSFSGGKISGYILYKDGGSITLARSNAGAITAIDTASLVVSTNTNYEFGISATGTSITAYIKEVGAGSNLADLSATDATYASGSSALSANALGVSYDDFSSASASPIAILEQPSQNQCIQRSTTSGGLFSKGSASVPFNVTIEGSSLEYRIIDATTEVAVNSYTSAGSGGSFSIDVPANTQWYKIEFRMDGADTLISDNAFAVGDIVCVGGQSLAVRMFKNISDATTLADLGIVVSDYAVTYATYSDSSTTDVTAPQWLKPADGSAIDSAFAAGFLNAMIAQNSVVTALAGYSRGATTIEELSTTYWANLTEIFDGVGEFSRFIWFQGHSNAANGTTKASYKTSLTDFFDAIDLYAGFSNYEKTLLSIPNKNSASFGTVEQVDQIRQAAYEWSSENSATYIQPHDILLVDGVHQGQVGNVALSRNIFRSIVGIYAGALLYDVVRTGATLRLFFAIQSGADALVVTGSLASLIEVSDLSDPYTFLSKDSVVAGSDYIDVTLSSDPLTDDLRVFIGESNTISGAAYLTDNYYDDGFSVGRLAVSDTFSDAQVVQVEQLTAGVTVTAPGHVIIIGGGVEVTQQLAGITVVAPNHVITIGAEPIEVTQELAGVSVIDPNHFIIIGDPVRITTFTVTWA